MQPNRIRLLAQSYLSLAFIQGLLFLAVMLREPSESEQAVLFGFSATRVVLALALLAISLGWGFLLLASFFWRDWFDRQASILVAWLSRPKVWGWVFVLSLAGFCSGSYLLLLTLEVDELFTRMIIDRVVPLFLYLSGLCAQNLLVLGVLRAPLVRQNKKTLFLFLFFYLLLVLLAFHPWLSIVTDAAGFREQALGWNEMGAPILDTQVFLAWLVALGLAGLFSTRMSFSGKVQSSRHFSPRLVDWTLVLGLWLAGAVLWNSLPIIDQYYISRPLAPNFEYYPKSDALGYDLTAQIMLAGEGYHFVTDLLSHRPMHTLYLTLLHLVAGQDYERVVFFQVCLLAIFPVLVYLLTRKLANRLAGLIAALLVLLRQANSIAEASSFSSHAKSLLVDLPGAVGVALLLLLLFRWLEEPRRRLVDLLLAGGIWGMLILLRQEFAGLALTILLALVVAYWRLPRWMIKGGLVFGLGALLVLSPWLYRNSRVAGLTFRDTIRVQAGFVRWRYMANTSAAAEQEADTPNLQSPAVLVPPLGTPFPRFPVALAPAASPLPQTKDASPGFEEVDSAPQLPGTPAPSAGEIGSQLPLSGAQRSSFTGGLGVYAESVLMHMINNQDQLVFYLPGSFRIIESLIGFLGHQNPHRLWAECCSMKNYMRRLTFWPEWDGRFLRQSILVLLANLFLLSVGIAVASRSPRRIAGLLPLLVAVNYFLVNAAIQNSGGRYIIPVDWVSLLYYSAGLSAVSWWLVSILRGRFASSINAQPGDTAFQSLFVDKSPLAEEPGSRQRFSLHNPWLVAALVGLFLVGCALPLLEKAIPPANPPQVQAAMLEQLLELDRLSDSGSNRLQNLLAEPGSAVYAGRAIYPRFFKTGEGETDSGNPFTPRPYNYLGFYLAGPESRSVVMPLEAPPQWLPHTADVLVFAGEDGRAAAIAVFDRDHQPVQLLYRP